MSDARWTTQLAIEKVAEWTERIGAELAKSIWTQHQDRQRAWINDLAYCKEVPTYLVALLGGTGAGKSSLINALMGANIIPTSSLRACTSCILEIEYHSDDTFAADIRFISASEWQTETQKILGDAQAAVQAFMRKMKEEKNRRKVPLVTQMSNDVKSAWAQIKTVHNDLEWKEFINLTTTESLISRPEVQDYLGKSISIVKENGNDLAPELSRYIFNDGKIHNGPWPLVRNVKIRCRAQCLSSGVTLVDLPGIADANSARYAVTENYIKKCDHIWHIVPVDRAADSKVTSDVVGLAKNQFKMDGLYKPEKWTHIVTMCDKVTNSEDEIKSLGIGDDETIKRNQAEIQKLEQEIPYFLVNSEAEPTEGTDESTLKRKCMLESEITPKRARHEVEEIPESQSETIVSQATYPPRLRSETSILARREAISTLKRELKAYCAKKRSEEVYFDLMQKIVNEFEEFQMDDQYYDDDESTARAHDAPESDGTSPMRFEDEVDELDPDEYDNDGNGYKGKVQSGPLVFTTSAGDFVKIKRRQESETVTFSTEDETQIPQLMDHCRRLAEAPRRLYVAKSVERVASITESVDVYIEELKNKDESTKEELRQRWGETGESLEAKLTEALNNEINTALEQMGKVFRTQLGAACRAGEQAAVENASRIADMVQQNDVMGWQRRRATFRRHGTWYIDINQRFLEPYTNCIAQTWGRLFERNIFNSIRRKVKKRIFAIVADVRESCTTSASITRAERLDHTIRKEIRAVLPIIAGKLSGLLETKGKEISRTLIPSIRVKLRPAYESTLRVTGLNSVARQGDHFNDCIFSRKDTLFSELSGQLLGTIDDITEIVRQ